MGSISEMMLDGILDEQTGEYLGDAVGYPRTKEKGHYNTIRYKETQAEKNIRTVRKELAILIEKNRKDNIINPVQTAREDINKKYGKGWRERGLISNSDDQWKDMSEY